MGYADYKDRGTAFWTGAALFYNLGTGIPTSVGGLSIGAGDTLFLAAGNLLSSGDRVRSYKSTSRGSPATWSR